VLDGKSGDPKDQADCLLRFTRNNFSEKTIVPRGIDGQGYALAKILEKELKIDFYINAFFS